jgi:hypothetical protein
MCDPITLGVIAGASASAAGTTAVTALAVGGITMGVTGMIDSQKQAGKAAKMQQAMESRKAQRSQLQALREAQIQRAMLTQRSATSGTMGSSGFAGGMSSIGSQLAGNIGFSREMTAFGQGISRYNQQANRSAALGQLGFQAASFGMQAGAFASTPTPDLTAPGSF